MRPDHPVLVQQRQLSLDFEYALDDEHHVRPASVVFVEHQCARVLQAPGQDTLAEFGDLFAILQHDRILADQIDAADVAVEVDANARPVQPRRDLLDMRRLAGAVIALDHRAAVEGKPGEDRQRRLAIELVGGVDVRYVLGTHRKGRYDHVGVDLEHLACRNLGVRQIDRGSRANFGQGGNLVHRLGSSCLLGGKSNPGSRWCKSSGFTPRPPRWARASGASAERRKQG